MSATGAEPSAFAARHALVDGALVGPTTIEHQGPTLTAVRPWRAGDPPIADGTLLPGLVNAHLHLELSWAHERVPGGQGFDGWVRRLLALRAPEDARAQAEARAQGMARSGTAAVCDIANRPGTAKLLDAAGLGGIVQRELFTLDRGRLPGQLAAAAEPPTRVGALVCRPSPHAVYSTAPTLIQATVRADGLGHPASIHLAEDPAEHALLRDGTGPLAVRLDELGLDWRWWTPPGLSPLAWMDALGVLGPELLLVHGVHLDAADRALLASSGASLCLCPRSNLHIGGRLPDVPALIAAGVPLCLGTDSLASAPDLDVLGELGPLTEAFPAVPLLTWLVAATAGGADALKLPWAGRLAPGRAPGVLRLDGPLDASAPARRTVLLPPAPPRPQARPGDRP